MGDVKVERHLRLARWLLLVLLLPPLLREAWAGSWPLGWLLLCLATLSVQLVSMLPRPVLASRRLLLFLLLDILLWNGLVALTGGASNPFSALLLIPLALACLLLPVSGALLVLAVSIGCQLLQLQFVAVEGQGAMTGHFEAMVMGFAIAALLLSLALLYLRQKLRDRDRDLHQLRESQLRDEQLLAVGTAAAQLTHEMATPVQSLSLLLEEMEDQGRVPPAMRQQLGRMEQLLADWRYIAEDLRERRLRPLSMAWVLRSVRELLLITRPGDKLLWEILPQAQEVQVQADRTLIPAILSLVHNALDAARGSGVRVQAGLEAGHWRLIISNGGEPLEPEVQSRLGTELLASEKGMGVGAALSNATLERFGGRVYWQSRDGQTWTRLELPVYKP